VLSLVAALVSAQPAASAKPIFAAHNHDAGRVDIGGGRHLYLECRGEGGPTVILEAGYRSHPSVWTEDFLRPEEPRTMVLDGVAAFTRVCLYERPGAPFDADHPRRSDPVPQPRTVDEVVADLHALLVGAGVPGPYVLVGHSLGGLVARLYAATYPEEVGGMVLIDAFSEHLLGALTPEQATALLQLSEAQGLADDPDLETLDLRAAAERMRVAPPVPPMPLSVLSAGRLPSTDLGPDVLQALRSGFADALDEAARVNQAALAELVPGARHVVAAGSGHNIHLEQPDLVIAAVRQVAEAVLRTTTDVR